MFLYKKIAEQLLSPVTFCAIIILVGWALSFRKKPRTGRVFVITGTVLLVVLSYGFIADLTVAPLESRYPPLTRSRIAELQPAVAWIAVLGGGVKADSRLSPRSRLGNDTLARVAEGVDLKKSFPRAKIIFSAGPVFDKVAGADVMAEAAEEMGVNPKDIVREDSSLDTEHQARVISKMVGKEPFILVTSAAHMPRAVALFKKAGSNPVPAPCDFMAKRSSGAQTDPRMFFPHATELAKSHAALHEYTGILWSKLRRKI